MKNYSVPNPSANKKSWDHFFASNPERWFDVCTTNGIDPIIMIAIAVQESGWGTSKIAWAKGNLWGFGADDSDPMGHAKSFIDQANGDTREASMLLLEYICRQLKALSDNPHAKVDGNNAEFYYQIARANMDKIGETGEVEFTTLRGVSFRWNRYWEPNGEGWANDVCSNTKTIFADFVAQYCGGDIIQVADMIHKYMEQNSYTYCVYGSNSYEECGKHGKSHGLSSTFEASKANKNTCCATYVSWVLQEAGYITSAEHTNGADEIYSYLVNKKGWIVINSLAECEPGDVLYYPDHVEIYAGDGTKYNAGSGEAIRGASPSKIGRSFNKAIRPPN